MNKQNKNASRPFQTAGERLDDVLGDAAAGTSAQGRKEAVEYARAWSMDTLAGRYLEVYGRAMESFRATH